MNQELLCLYVIFFLQKIALGQYNMTPIVVVCIFDPSLMYVYIEVPIAGCAGKY